MLLSVAGSVLPWRVVGGAAAVVVAPDTFAAWEAGRADLSSANSERIGVSLEADCCPFSWQRWW